MPSEPWTVLVAILAYTGMRPGEALALRWDDIGEQTIRVERAVSLCDGSTHGTKTDTARSVRLLAPVAADLAAWRLRSGRPGKAALVIPHPAGAWTKDRWDGWRRGAFNGARDAAKLGDMRPYDLRHSFASLLLAEGRAIHYVAEQLGHSAEMTLRTYGHVIADYRDRQTIDADAEIRKARGGAYPSGTLSAAASRIEGAA